MNNSSIYNGLFVVLSATLTVSLCSAAPPTADFYVATNGSDDWSGTVSEPDARQTDGPFEALVKVSPTAGKDRKLTFPDAGLNTDIAYQIKLQDGVLSLTVNGMTQTENIIDNDADWANQTFYFKAGAYTQDNDGPASEGSRVAFSVLKISHAGRLTPICSAKSSCGAK